jgi:hypothetical protein
MNPDTARDDARAALLDVLAVHVDAGRPVPCLSVPGPERGVWTSDHPQEQALARTMCDPCPAIDPCRLYGQQYPRELGTYGGRTNVGRPQPRRKVA